MNLCQTFPYIVLQNLSCLYLVDPLVSVDGHYWIHTSESIPFMFVLSKLLHHQWCDFRIGWTRCMLSKIPCCSMLRWDKNGHWVQAECKLARHDSMTYAPCTLAIDLVLCLMVIPFPGKAEAEWREFRVVFELIRSTQDSKRKLSEGEWSGQRHTLSRKARAFGTTAE